MLNCESASKVQDACGVCKSCELMTKESHPDYVEKDMGSYGLVSDMRLLSEHATMKPTWNYRVFTLDEIHGASREAFNALLKLLEDPPRTAAFVLCTTDPEKVPHTIVSRSLFLKLSPLSRLDMVTKVKAVMEKEKITADEEVVEAMVRASGGSMRDCYMNLERLGCLAGGKEITKDVVQGEFWYQAAQAAPKLIKALVERSIQSYKEAQRDLSSRSALEFLVKDALELVCRIYVAKSKKSDKLVESLWTAYRRIQMGLEPELVMEGLWIDMQD